LSLSQNPVNEKKFWRGRVPLGGICLVLCAGWKAFTENR
jgi:hypothetical protein